MKEIPDEVLNEIINPKLMRQYVKESEKPSIPPEMSAILMLMVGIAISALILIFVGGIYAQTTHFDDVLPFILVEAPVISVVLTLFFVIRKYVKFPKKREKIGN